MLSNTYSDVAASTADRIVPLDEAYAAVKTAITAHGAGHITDYTLHDAMQKMIIALMDASTLCISHAQSRQQMQLLSKLKGQLAEQAEELDKQRALLGLPTSKDW